MSQSPQCKVAISKVINQELFEEKVILISKAILDPAKENYFMLVDRTRGLGKWKWMACNYRSYEDAIIKMEITDDTNERRGQNEKNTNIGQTRDIYFYLFYSYLFLTVY